MNVLAVGAHWDDIEIGCALSLMKLKKMGANLFGAVLTESDYEMSELNHIRQKSNAYDEGIRSFKKIGIEYKKTTPLPNQQMKYDQKTMQELEKIVSDCKIDMVFTHWFGDHNTDHAGTWEISRVAFRRVKTLLMYQSNSYFDNVNTFIPHYFYGFSKSEYEEKKDLIALHESEWEYRKERWEREIFDRERFYGYQCGNEYAEAFMISRMVFDKSMSQLK